MSLKRKVVGHGVVLIGILVTAVSVWQRWIVMSDISAALAYALVGVVVAALYWTWKPEITHWFTERKQPKLTVSKTKLKDDEKITAIEVRFWGGGVKRYEARFCYVTVKNTGKRSAEDVHAYYDGAERIMFMPLRRKEVFKLDYPGTVQDFEHEIGDFGEPQAFVVAALRYGKLEWERTIHPGPVAETFVLLFSVRDFRCLTIPAGSRLYPNYNEGIPCSFRLPLILVGKDMPEYYLTIFKVTVDRWDHLNVEQVGETKRCQVTGEETIPELMSRPIAKK